MPGQAIRAKQIDPNGLLYTTVVSTDAELASALTTNGGDTFIKAGSYTIDLDTIGALDTTPRAFTGAGRDGLSGPNGNGVYIEIISTGIGLSELDFSASLNEGEGVEFANISWFGSAPAIGALLVGCYGVRNCNFDMGTGVFFGLSTSRNVSNCWAGNSPAGGAGFGFCDNLVNCTVGSPDPLVGAGAETGFFVCEELTNCQVYYEDGAIGGFIDAFFACDGMTNCRVEAAGVTSSAGFVNAARFCTRIDTFVAVGPTVGSLAGWGGVVSCDVVENAIVTSWESNYTGSTQLVNCRSFHGVGGAAGSSLHYIVCNDLTNCRADGTGDPLGATALFDTCDVLSNCRALNGPANGFSQCNTMTSCWAVSNTDDGFTQCTNLAGCRSATNGANGFASCTIIAGGTSTTNGGDAYNACTLISAVRAIGNTGFDYAAVNVNVSNATGDAAGLGLTDGSNLVVDPVTAAGI